MSKTRCRASLGILGLMLIASGCHTFRPTTVDQLTAGQDVRATVTGAYSDSLRAMLGDDAREFEGSFVERTASSVFLDVGVMSEYQGMRLQTLNQRIEVPADALVAIEHKELSRPRTALAIGGVVAIGAGILIAQLNSDTGGGVRPGEGGPVDAIVSVPSMGLVQAISWLWSH